MKEKNILGGAVKILIGIVVATFLALHSINFFQFTFPAEQQIFAWLGFGLTGGAAVGYLIVFLTEADTPLKRVIALGMMTISAVGEIITAFFGVQVETWKKLGFILTETDYQNMIVVVMILALVHSVALISYLAGDKIYAMFQDTDGDGKMDGFQAKRTFASTVQNTPIRHTEAPGRTNWDANGKDGGNPQSPPRS